MGVFSIGKTVIGSLFKKPSTLMYPVIPREWEERTRGAVAIDVDGCVLCGMCGRACPTNAIEVDRKAGTWSIERMACIQCRGCVDNCPPGCLSMDPKYTEPGGEKIVDTFEVPQKKKAAKKDAPAKDAAAKDAPAKEAAPAEDGDGPLTCDKETCVYCGLCSKACPVEAIKVERKPEKIWEVDEDECIKCGACIEKCPKDSLSFGGAAAAEPAKEEAKKEEPKKEEAKKEEPKKEEAKKEEPKKEAKKDSKKDSNKEAKKEAEEDPKLEGYLADVKASLIKDFGFSESDAAAKLEESDLADQLKAFPYLMNKDAKETAEKIK